MMPAIMESPVKHAMGVRGASWKREETQDLIAIWGERSIQQKLSQSARNGDIYGEIARGMAARGHTKSMEACRTKAKNLKKEYKKVLSHNGKSGMGPTTCPFFNELQQIFAGDGSVIPRRLVHSMAREVLPPPRTGRMGTSTTTLVDTERSASNDSRVEAVLRAGSVAGAIGGEGRHGELMFICCLYSTPTTVSHSYVNAC